MKIIHYLKTNGALDDDAKAEAFAARLERHKYIFVAAQHWKLDGVKECDAIVSDDPEIIEAYEKKGIGQWKADKKPKPKAKKRRGRPKKAVEIESDPDMPSEWSNPPNEEQLEIESVEFSEELDPVYLSENIEEDDTPKDIREP